MRLSTTVLRYTPARLRPVVLKHREAVKFIVSGGICFAITVVINYALKATIFGDKPVTALTIATIISTIVSYVLNREWSFRTRGGRARHHEATLFFLVNGVGVVINDIPLLISRYVLQLRVPDVSRPVQEIADFLSGIIVGTLLAMGFRLWAYRKFVFPHADARPRKPSPSQPSRRSRGKKHARHGVTASGTKAPAKVQELDAMSDPARIP
jgi:putative flippase GtrA